MSSDGYPEAVDALRIASEVIMRTAHANQMTLPHVGLEWLGREPTLEVKWYPTIDKEDAAALIKKVRAAFLPEGEHMIDNATYLSYETDLHGISIDFTIYTR